MTPVCKMYAITTMSQIYRYYYWQIFSVILCNHDYTTFCNFIIILGLSHTTRVSNIFKYRHQRFVVLSTNFLLTQLTTVNISCFLPVRCRSTLTVINLFIFFPFSLEKIIFVTYFSERDYQFFSRVHTYTFPNE